MNLAYVSLSYIPSRRASSVHVMRMCAALGRAGHSVKLIAKRGHEVTAAASDDHAFYGVPATFEIVKLSRPAWRGGGALFLGRLAATLLVNRPIELVYSRDVGGALVAAELGFPTLFEAHEVPAGRVARALLRRVVRHRNLRGMIAISMALRADLERDGFAPSSRIIVAHDAADIPAGSQRDPRKGSRPRIGYVGNLYRGRGIEMVVELAARLPDYEVEVIGGTESDVAAWRSRVATANLTFRGFVAPVALPEHYRSFDVLLMPHQRTGVGAATGTDISRWTSPMKMFEYMASRVPIVASDLPVLGEILKHEVNALIAPSNDLDAWERAIRRLVEDRRFAARLAERALEDLQAHHTWDARVRTIFGGLSDGREQAPRTGDDQLNGEA